MPLELPLELLLVPLPQAVRPRLRPAHKSIVPSKTRQARRREGSRKSSSPARASPPDQGWPGRAGVCSAAELAAVVERVSVACFALVSVIDTEDVLRLRVGRLCAPVGLVVIEAASATVPVKPPEGVMVSVAVLPAPLVTVSVVGEEVRVMSGVVTEPLVTVTEAVPVAEL